LGSYPVAEVGKLVQIYKINININGKKQYTKQKRRKKNLLQSKTYKTIKQTIKRID